MRPSRRPNSIAPTDVTHGRYRVCRPLGTAYGVAAESRPTPSTCSLAGRCAPPPHSLPPATSENARLAVPGRASNSVFRSPLDKSAVRNSRVETHRRTYPHRPRALRLLDRFIPSFSGEEGRTKCEQLHPKQAASMPLQPLDIFRWLDGATRPRRPTGAPGASSRYDPVMSIDAFVWPSKLPCQDFQP